MGYASTAPAFTYGATDNVLQDDATQYTKNGTTYQLVKTFYQIGIINSASYFRFKAEMNCQAGAGVNHAYVQIRYYDTISEATLWTDTGSPEGVWTPVEGDFNITWKNGGEIRVYIASEQAAKDVYIRNEELCGELSPFIQ